MIERLSNRMARTQREGGFTLIELLVVIIIIGILLAVAVPSYLSFRDRANKSAAQSNVRAIVPAIESYYSDQGTYATMTLALLKSTYDASIDTADYQLSGVTASSYCVSSGPNGGWYGKKVGPAGWITVSNGRGVTC